MTKQRIVIENEEILLRMLSDLLNTSKERLALETQRQQIYLDLVTALRELTESSQEIATKLPYFE
tara:strand:- start:1807 stop:2001 length:195 start_codon:yes stop_codon:yes gene_type:complete